MSLALSRARDRKCACWAPRVVARRGRDASSSNIDRPCVTGLMLQGGLTALIRAAYAEHAAVVSALLEAGADRAARTFVSA
jgi:hypothetical protein